MDKRTELLDEEIAKVIELVGTKIDARLNEKHRGSYIGNHETYGILAEEYKELLDALQANQSHSFCLELIDIAVGAILGIASMYANARTQSLEQENA